MRKNSAYSIAYVISKIIPSAHTLKSEYGCLELLKEAESRFIAYQMDVDSEAPYDHLKFMSKLHGYIQKSANGQSDYCPDCGEDPCVCVEEHPNSYYSDPPGEHEFQMEEKINVLQPDSKLSDLVKIALYELIKNKFNAFEFDIHVVGPTGPIVMHFNVTMQEVVRS